MTTMTAPRNVGTAPQFGLELAYPMSLGTYEDYRQAQRVVDYLSDRDFPVQNVAIVGTELRSVERVTGRLTRGKLAMGGALSGLWMGLFVGIAFSLFSHPGSELALLLGTPLLGALFGLIWSQLGFRMVTRSGARDFSSVSQLIATRYEVLVEHHLAAEAHQVLAGMPGQSVGTGPTAGLG
jgi:hypothetical protein